MEISQKLLCFLFLASLLVGIALGLLYDLLGFLRLVLQPHNATAQCSQRKRLLPHFGRILLFFEDLFFVILCGSCLIILLYLINDGIFRFWAPLGMGCGFFLYKATLGQLFEMVANPMALGVRRILKLVRTMLWIPIRTLGRWILHLIIKPLAGAIDRKRLHKQITATAKITTQFISNAEEAFEKIAPINTDF